MPIAPPAPVTSSTTTGWPSEAVIGSARMWHSVSSGPPAENGTMIVTGLVGNACALAANGWVITGTLAMKVRRRIVTSRVARTLTGSAGTVYTSGNSTRELAHDVEVQCVRHSQDDEGLGAGRPRAAVAGRQAGARPRPARDAGAHRRDRGVRHRHRDHQARPAGDHRRRRAGQQRLHAGPRIHGTDR